MLMMSASPFVSLLAVFVVVPMACLIGIYGSEGASSLRRRHQTGKRPAMPPRAGDQSRVTTTRIA